MPLGVLLAEYMGLLSGSEGFWEKIEFWEKFVEIVYETSEKVYKTII